MDIAAQQYKDGSQRLIDINGILLEKADKIQKQPKNYEDRQKAKLKKYVNKLQRFIKDIKIIASHDHKISFYKNQVERLELDIKALKEMLAEKVAASVDNYNEKCLRDKLSQLQNEIRFSLIKVDDSAHWSKKWGSICSGFKTFLYKFKNLVKKIIQQLKGVSSFLLSKFQEQISFLFGPGYQLQEKLGPIEDKNLQIALNDQISQIDFKAFAECERQDLRAAQQRIYLKQMQLSRLKQQIKSEDSAKEGLMEHINLFLNDELPQIQEFLQEIEQIE